MPYSHLVTGVNFDLNGKPAATGRVPRATPSWHHWDCGPIGTITFAEAGIQVLDLPLRQRQQLGLLGVRAVDPTAGAMATGKAKE